MKRWLLGALVAFAGIGILGAVMVPLRAHVSLATPALVLVVPVVAGVAVGGLGSGVLAVAAGFITYDVLFIPPYGTLTVGAAQNWTALAVYAVVMLIVARIFAFLGRARLDARRDADATRRLYELSDLLIGDQPVTGVLQVIAGTLHQAFGADWAAVLIPDAEHGDRLVVAATAGDLPAGDLGALAPAGGRPERLQAGAAARTRADRVVRIALVARGRPVGLVAMAGTALDHHELELVRTYANQAALALEASQLREQALRAELLEQVDALRASLIGAVSHDLRTPLASVKTAVSALRRGEGGNSLGDRDREELLALIEDRSDALDRLVANLLDMTRIRSGAFELRRAITPVPDVVEGGVRASAVPAGSVTVDLPADLPPVDVDVVLMEQVLANLLDNAARHSPDGEPVRIAATASGDVVELSVSDRGPGVPAGERERVFEMFSRVGAQGRAGLGLAIAKAFVEAHGQTIHVEEAPGGGARFVITLPAAPVPVEV
ncbi:MAG TPA: ATP-binding protein [Acidimicrobiales bacterium]|nr:ATP-binding protein [Acidimicrobiales bacterium]